ncbi:MAG: hypothetical protein LBK41_09075 [Clostridiales bacterium]|jgi:predicted secreted protein|nr:hypothetical protein [Clostridiales bacterium]
MVYPVNAIKFKIGLNGRGSSPESMAEVADMETFGVSFDSGVVSWNPLTEGGWARRLVTGKSVAISLKGKRNYGDPGNDYVASLAYAGGEAASTVLSAVFPDGSSLTMDCVVNVKSSDGGGASDVSALEFEALSDGEPVYTAGGAQQ